MITPLQRSNYQRLDSSHHASLIKCTKHLSTRAEQGETCASFRCMEPIIRQKKKKSWLVVFWCWLGLACHGGTPFVAVRPHFFSWHKGGLRESEKVGNVDPGTRHRWLGVDPFNARAPEHQRIQDHLRKGTSKACVDSVVWGEWPIQAIRWT